MLKKLPEQLGLHCYAVSTHPDELVLDPPLKKSWIRLWPLHKHGGAQWRSFWRRFFSGPQIRWGIRGQLPPNLFCAAQNFVVLRKICFKHMIKIFPSRMYFAPLPNLKTWLRAWFFQNYSGVKVFLKAIQPGDVA